MDILKLKQLISYVVPIESIVIGKTNDKSTWEIRYGNVVPTTDQLAQVKTIINNYRLLTQEQIATNMQSQTILTNSQDHVIRYLEQVAAGLSTTLTLSEFQTLVAQREAARNAIVTEG